MSGDPQVGAPYAIYINAGWRVPFTGLLCKEPPYGGIRVIDLATGATIWDRPFGLARANGPFGIPSMLPILIGTPNNGGSAVTASGLIFIAAATDNLIRAIDIQTGEMLWKDVLPAGGQAGPMRAAIISWRRRSATTSSRTRCRNEARLEPFSNRTLCRPAS